MALWGKEYTFVTRCRIDTSSVIVALNNACDRLTTQRREGVGAEHGANKRVSCYGSLLGNINNNMAAIKEAAVTAIIPLVTHKASAVKG